MKRKHFLDLFATAGVVALVPFKTIASSNLFLRVKEGFIVLAGKDRNDKPQTVFGSDLFTTKVAPEDTDGICIYLNL